MDYEFLKYETGSDGITTITLNRPRVNAFNSKMRGELSLALDRFERASDERVLILTGAGRFFSTGEDLNNINLDWNNVEMMVYAKETLGVYHMIVRSILLIRKPIIAALNGIAAGAGLSIALACDYRFAVKSEKIIVPAFAKMGLIADSGMTAFLPRLMRSCSPSDAFLACDGITAVLGSNDALNAGIIDWDFPADEFFMMSVKERFPSLHSLSPLAYAFSKEMRNKALVRELNNHVFPWEIRAQTECLQSEYFKKRAIEFLANQGEVR